MSKVFMALQSNEETRAIIEAIVQDNEEAEVEQHPAMVKINCESSLVLKRETVEELIGRPFDLQEVHINLISISGHVDETEDELTLAW